MTRKYQLYCRGLSEFYTRPGIARSIRCVVCGTECTSRRNLYNDSVINVTVSTASYDEFKCPNVGSKWHWEAQLKVKELGWTSNQTLRQTLYDEVHDILRANGVEYARV